MDICNKCGEFIEFRYINGSPKPIHLNGWCKGYTSKKSERVNTNKYTYVDITRKTKCPKCSEKVYFIQHNGGSVWVDSLGWPWPKHACFSSEIESKLYSFFENKSYLNGSETFTGVVINARWVKDTNGSKILLNVRYNNSFETIIIPGIFVAHKLQNTLVLINLEKKRIVFSSFDESEILNQQDILSNPKKGQIPIETKFSCNWCKKKFNLSIDLDKHVSRCHNEKTWIKHIHNPNVKDRLKYLKRCQKCKELVKNIDKHMKKVHKIEKVYYEN